MTIVLCYFVWVTVKVYPMTPLCYSYARLNSDARGEGLKALILRFAFKNDSIYISPETVVWLGEGLKASWETGNTNRTGDALPVFERQRETRVGPHSVSYQTTGHLPWKIQTSHKDNLTPLRVICFAFSSHQQRLGIGPSLGPQSSLWVFDQ